MNSIDIRYQQHTPAIRGQAASPAHWRIGKASVSTEELQAWQLGPARFDHWLAYDATPESARG